MGCIDDLIDKCSNNKIVFYRLDDLVEFRNGKGHEKNIVDDGKYVVVNSKFISTNGEVKKYSDEQISPLYVNDILMVMSDLPNGRALAKCYLVDENDKYTLNQRIGAFKVKRNDIVSVKYLYYYLNRNKQLLKYDNGVDQTNLRKDDILNIKIAIPSIEIQCEIVNILDTFAELLKELSKELYARKKQFTFYRDKLLSIKGSQYNLGEVAEFKTGTKPKNILENGCYEYINAGTTNSGYVDEVNFKGDIVTTPSRGQGGIGFVGYQKDSFWLGPLCYAIWSKNQNIVLNKYIYYELSSKKDEILKRKNTGGVPSLNGCDLKTIPLNIPTIEEQQRIINTLNMFEEICEDKIKGLPVEIEKIQKQFEYYKDKLLSFKEAE